MEIFIGFVAGIAAATPVFLAFVRLLNRMIAQQMLHNEVIATELKAQIEAQRRELADCMDRNFGLLGEIGDIKELRGESNGMLSKDLQDAKMEKRIEDIKKESDDEAPEHPPRKRK